MPPVILVAPAAFKGTLGPRQVADAIAAGVRRAVAGAVVLECPVADGGNGLLDVVLPAGNTTSSKPFPPSATGHSSTTAPATARRTPAAMASAT